MSELVDTGSNISLVALTHTLCLHCFPKWDELGS